jgi:hypothetical protein
LPLPITVDVALLETVTPNVPDPTAGSEAGEAEPTLKFAVSDAAAFKFVRIVPDGLLKFTVPSNAPW